MEINSEENRIKEITYAVLFVFVILTYAKTLIFQGFSTFCDVETGHSAVYFLALCQRTVVRNVRILTKSVRRVRFPAR